MQYFRTITDQFRDQKWFENLMFVTLCILIPVVGPLLLIGYCTYGIVATRDEPFAQWPRFNFDRFGDYLAAGLWPFLVNLATVFAVMPLVLLAMAPIFFVMIAQAEEEPNLVTFLAIVVSMILYLGLIVVMMLITMPMILRSALEQKFSSAFSLRYICGFIAQVWKEMITTQLFIMFISIPMMLIGYMMCLVGVYPAAAVMALAQWHLKHQIYNLYLERGGEPIVIADKLLEAAAQTPSDPAPPSELPAPS